MPLPVIFANLPAGDNPATLLDQQFASLAYFVIVPCQATGTNDLQLAPFADAPVQVSYQDLAPAYIWFGELANSGNVTLNVSGLGAFPLFKNGGADLVVAGDLLAGSIYRAIFSSRLNNGAGGFTLL